MAKLLYEGQNYAFRIDEIAMLSVKKGDPGSVREAERRPRLEVTFKGNGLSTVILFGDEEEAREQYREIVKAMAEE